MTGAGQARVVDSYELSPTQEGMLFHWLLGEGSGVDHEQVVCTIRGPVDADRLVRAFDEVAARHPILRTRFRYEDVDRPTQEVVDSVQIPLERLDLSDLDAADRSSRFAEALRQDRARGIELGSAPCMRLLVADCGPDGHHVVWAFHHALLDGRSFPIVLRDVFETYDSGPGGRAPAVPPPRAYREYIEFLRGLDLVAGESYWRDRLAGFTAPTPLVIDRPVADEQRETDVQGAFERRLSREETTRLRDYAASRGVTLNTLIQAAWAVLLHRYSGETEVVFGATRACRRSTFTDADRMVGLFINTLPLRVSTEPNTRVNALLDELRARQLEIRAHEHTPLASVQRWSDVPSGRALFETIVVYEEGTLDTMLRSLDAGDSRVSFAYHGQTNYPITLVAYGDDEMLVRLESDRRRVDDGPASRMLNHFLTVLAAMPQHAEREIQELSLLSDDERSALVADPQAPALAFAGCLHERFAERAASAGDRVAAVCGEESLTYRALDGRANALALRLQSAGVERGVLVGLRTERSLNLLVGILGILKAGGAYVPLDPAYPRERVDFMLADSGVQVVVTEAGFAEDFAEAGMSLALVDGDLGEAESGPAVVVEPDDLAYVIYTSGSTGQPKGVVISHRNVGRLFDSTDHWFGFGETDVWTLFHSYAFDFSVWEMWGALLYGGRVVVVPFWIGRSPQAFRELVAREGVTVLNQTPSAFRQFIAADAVADPTEMTELRYVVFGGEALEPSTLRPWFDRHGDAAPQLINMYGITETTVHVTYRPISFTDLGGGTGSAIGVPIPDLRLWVLDEQRSPVPTGIPGEIYVGGGGVAAGYLERPELTAERFVPDPFGGGDAKLYRTGDLARRLENGELEYLGRIDDQVKIRGFRIELGEIEAVLAGHPAVADAVVLARADTGHDKRLVAYVVASNGGELIDRLKDHLRSKLPEYMVPAHFVVMSELPLTSNGKTDRKSLPAPDYGRREDERPYVAPRTALEKTLANIWATVLGAPRVSIDDNFLELGGDSILTIQVIARCRQAGLPFSPRDLAKHPSVAQLAAMIKSATRHSESPPDLELDEALVVPMPIESWFFEHRFADPYHWNQAFLFAMPSGIDLGALQRAFDHVVARHDALRVRVAGGVTERTLHHDPGTAAPEIRRIDLAPVAPSARAARIEVAAASAEAGLDLHEGPLLAAVHFDCGAAPGRLLIVVHHLAIDGVSWRVLIEDLESAYSALRSGSPVDLPAPSASVRQWARALVDAAGPAGPFSQAATHWLDTCAVAPQLGKGTTGPGQNSEEHAATITVALDAGETRALLQRASAAYRTQINDLLLTALALALRKWTGSERHRIDLEGHGREEEIVPLDVSRTIGWFTALYPVVLDLDGADDDGSAVKVIKEGLRAVPDRGLSYGALRYGSGHPAVAERLAAQPPAELLFNYLGQFDRVVAGSELFGFASESTGPWHGPQNERTHRLEVMAVVREGRLEARWTYGTECENKETIQLLADDFIVALRQLIVHCTTPGVSGRTPSDFPLARLGQAELDSIVERYPEIDDVYPLSPMQRLFLSMETGGAGLGFEQWVFRLTGRLDPAALRKAWEATVARHAMLRTAFVTTGVAEPLQVVNRDAALGWAEVDGERLSPTGADGALESFLARDRGQGIDVGVAPLTRITLIRLSDDDHRLVWSTHHLCVDGWSWPLVLRDVGAHYEALRTGSELRLPAPRQYGAYIRWLDDSAPDSQQFWSHALAGFVSATPLPVEATPITAGPDEVHESSLLLDASTTAVLEALARRLRVTLNTVVQGAWAAALSHLSGRDDIIFGAAFAGRPAELEGIETLVGPCVNNLPVRVTVEPARPASDWLAGLQTGNLDRAQHQFAGLPDIQQWAGVPWRLRLFDSLVVFQNYTVDEAVLRWGTVDVGIVATPEATNYPVTLTVTPGARMKLTLVGKANRFSPSTVATMLDVVGSILSSLAARPEAPLSEIEAGLPESTRGAADRAVAAAAERRRSSYAAPASEMERLVAEVWEELFDVDQVGVEENFFDLGGQSILLLQAHARLRERLGRDLAVVALLKYPTIRSLARHLSDVDTPNAALDAVADRATLQRRALARQRSRQGRR